MATFRPISYESWSRLYGCQVIWLRFRQHNLVVDGGQVHVHGIPGLCRGSLVDVNGLHFSRMPD